MQSENESQQAWHKGYPYYELSLGESLVLTGIASTAQTVTLESFDHKYVHLRVNASPLRLPLGVFDRQVGLLPLADRLNITDQGPLRIGVDVTGSYNQGSKYSLTLLNLAKDARLFIGKAGQPISPEGPHRFPLPHFDWDLSSNWLTKVPYGWHLGVDLYGDRGHPLISITDGTVVAIHDSASTPEKEDYWGNNLAIFGDDGILYCYLHWDNLVEGLQIGSRVKAGDFIGPMGRSGYDSLTKIPTHLHLEMMVLKHPEKFYFAYETDPDVLPTPNRYLQQEVEGHVINPFPYLLEWYQESRLLT